MTSRLKSFGILPNGLIWDGRYGEFMEIAQTIIRLGTGITMVAYGISQIARPAHWYGYVPEWLRRLLPVSEAWAMRAHGGGNLILGLWLMLGLAPSLAVWACLVWWISIWPFAFYYDWRDGMRDLTIIAGLAAALWLM